ncbi:MAG: lytic transglycosylase domain-containing protein [Deltaproteobacteria bacterium]|nr:lytic transglycosylase domain-containing protein [Deltaproteobacteria bacterium]
MVIPVFFNLLSLFYLTLSTTSFSALSSKLLQNIEDAAKRSYLDPKLVQAVIAVESNFDSKATSHKGAMGLMQVMPKTADICDVHEPHHAVNNLMGACECLRRLLNRYRGNLSLALAAYNAGPTNVDRHKGIPPFPETKAYVKKILSKYSELKRNPNR